MPISVIIPTYKEPSYLDLCLQSAITNQDNENEFIVVIDGFPELNLPIVEKYKNKNVNILTFETNRGLQEALNHGVINATNEKILLINDDNVFPISWDTRLEEEYQENYVISPNHFFTIHMS